MEINVQHSFVDVLMEAQKRYEQEKPYVIDAEVIKDDFGEVKSTERSS